MIFCNMPENIHIIRINALKSIRKQVGKKVSASGKNFYNIEEYRNFPRVLKAMKIFDNMPA